MKPWGSHCVKNYKTFPLPRIVIRGKKTFISQAVWAGFSCSVILTSSSLTAGQAVQGSDCHNVLITGTLSKSKTDRLTHCQTFCIDFVR